MKLSQCRRETVIALCAVFAIAFYNVHPLQAGTVDIAGLKEAEVRQFLAGFQDALQKNNPDEVAKYLNFPLRLCSNGPNDHVWTKRAFIKQYKQIITPEWRAVILSVKFEDLWANSEGVMIHHGALWFQGICLDKSCTSYKILVVTINLNAI